MELKAGFYKVAQSGGSFVTATFFNPDTGEEYTGCVRDYDYADCSRDSDGLYHMQIDEEARRDWQHHHGALLIGDFVEVFKGRKVAKGTSGVIIKIRPVYDRYRRWVADYAVLDCGKSTNIKNCRMLEAL